MNKYLEKVADFHTSELNDEELTRLDHANTIFMNHLHPAIEKFGKNSKGASFRGRDGVAKTLDQVHSYMDFEKAYKEFEPHYYSGRDSKKGGGLPKDMHKIYFNAVAGVQFNKLYKSLSTGNRP